ncbi:hypothetical protein BBK36DRAFT_1157838 [Trichoderma citrinoviride]|uniref:CFEM domain-containing protein n=1 Tax=Trichoderma citrinoviride TaxID=58853 RepID=A0A2T4BFQ8_9HYPO|nr:hypothetical protein BBK36DRAFT_1157838 [Trichoderma citrinoviride]PTB68166.1 hypothetical protein BBK36DRAFT_1157838 [Trichoderma citrinoviride]
MKTASLFFAASMAVAVAAKSLSDVLPKCAVDCAETALKGARCALDDTPCLCADQTTYQTLLQPAVECMVKACGQQETITKIAPAVVQFCAAANPKLPSPSSPAPAATKTIHTPSIKASSASASPAGSETASEASETTAPQKKWTSDQPSEVPEATASESATAAASEQPSSTTGTAAASSGAAAGAAGPMVTAALLVAGAVAML